MKLEHWKQYAKTINVGGKGIGNADIEDVFKNDEKDDYQEIIALIPGQNQELMLIL